MHRKRVITALVLIPLLLLLILHGGRGTLWAVLLGALALATHEYGAMVLRNRLFEGTLMVLSLGLGTVVYLGITPWPFIYGSLLIVASLALVSYQPGLEHLFRVCAFLAGLLYLPFTFVHLGLIADLPQGRFWLLFLMGVIFAGDTLAYYSGRALGRHALARRISPKKTVEGAIGGLVGSGAAAMVLGRLFFPSWTLFSLAELGIFLGFIGQIGDLFESVIKRAVGVKDSGRLLPGHGGLLDRVDALLLATPALYYWLKAIL